MTQLEIMGAAAKKASRFLMNAGSRKDEALLAIAKALRENSAAIIAANDIDIENGKASGLTESLLDRLRLDEGRIEGMATGVAEVAALPDPIGKILDGRTLKNGLKINRAIMDTMRAAIKTVGFPEDCIALVQDTTRQSATELMQLTDYLDVLIPRGGAGLIKSVVANAKVPVIETGVGNCHVYVDASADVEMAKNIVFNAKTSRPSVCNAIETVLVHKDIAEKALPEIKAALDTKNVEIRGCEKTREILGDSVIAATEDDYAREFLDYILAIKVVDSLDAAIEHIATYSTGHSESIVTSDYAAAEKFTACVDSAAVYVNASTRFTDGGEFGLGAEILTS